MIWTRTDSEKEGINLQAMECHYTIDHVSSLEISSPFCFVSTITEPLGVLTELIMRFFVQWKQCSKSVPA